MKLNSFAFVPVTEAHLASAINSTKLKTIGLNGIRLKFIKLILSFIVSRLLHIVNEIIVTSVFPKEWICSRVTTTPKVNNPNEVIQFRLIIVLPVLSKACEVNIRLQMIDYLSEKPHVHLNQAQSGLRKYISTTMIDITERIRVSMDA